MQETPEHTVFSIRPTLLFVWIGYFFAVIGAILVVILLYWIESLIRYVFPAFVVPFYISLFGGLLVLVIPAIKHFRRNLVSYTLTDAKIQINKGFFSHYTQNIPLRTIQDVTVSASILQRMFGYGSLIIENANEATGKIILKDIPAPQKYADLLLNEMRRN